jgi:hypothetical protein
MMKKVSVKTRPIIEINAKLDFFRRESKYYLQVTLKGVYKNGYFVLIIA